MTQHVLVTGAGGFSGAEVVRQLLAAGHRVTAAVGSSRGRLARDAERLGSLEVIQGDLANELPLPRRLDTIVHAAARSPGPGVTTSQMVRDNVVVTQRLVEHAKQAGVQTFVFFSSLSVYGRVETPIVDEATPVRDPDVYGLTKRVGEELVAAEEKTFRSLSIRLPGVIGPGSERNWLSGVLAAAKAGSEITIYNPRAPFNNAVHIADLAGFVGSVLKRRWSNRDVVTIGAAGETTVEDAVQMLVGAFGGRSHVRVAETRQRSFLISSARARTHYDYVPMDVSSAIIRFAQENGGSARK